MIISKNKCKIKINILNYYERFLSLTLLEGTLKVSAPKAISNLVVSTEFEETAWNKGVLPN